MRACSAVLRDLSAARAEARFLAARASRARLLQSSMFVLNAAVRSCRVERSARREAMELSAAETGVRRVCGDLNFSVCNLVSSVHVS